MSDEKHVTRHELGLELKVYKGEIVDELKAMLDEKIDGLSARLDTANIDRRDEAFFAATGFKWEDRDQSSETIQYMNKKMGCEKDTKKRAKGIFMGFAIPAALVWLIDRIWNSSGG